MRRQRTHPVILVHGGAGPRALTRAQRVCLSEALATGYDAMNRGLPAVEAVETAIRMLEASGLFNAGLGAKIQLDGVKRMDASIMQGRDLRAGAVAAIEQIRHPIQAARLVMEKTAHVLLVGDPATRFARHFKLTRQPVVDRTRGAPRQSRLQGANAASTRHPIQEMGKLMRAGRKSYGTVGAVALDKHGSLAAGASTGGISVMLPGRVGDSPLIGAGVYADDRTGAVSMTGLGEAIVRIAAAKAIIEQMAIGATPQAAARVVLGEIVRRVRGDAGALVLARDGRFTVRHSTTRMAAGYWDGRGKPVVGDKFK